MPELKPSAYALARGSELTGAPLVLARAAHLGASPEAIFRVLSDFERLPDWMPMMRQVRVDNRHAAVPGGVGAVRVIDSGFGQPTEETVVAFEPPTLLAYSASDRSLRGLFTSHLGVLVSEPYSAGGTSLTWLSYARAGKGPQRLLGPSVFKLVIEQSLSRLQRRFPSTGHRG